MTEDELAEFLKTGYLPEHVKKQPKQDWVPKDQWIKNKNKEQESKKVEEATKHYESYHNNAELEEDDDIMIDPFSLKRKA